VFALGFDGLIGSATAVKPASVTDIGSERIGSSTLVSRYTSKQTVTFTSLYVLVFDYYNHSPPLVGLVLDIRSYKWYHSLVFFFGFLLI
jgi:hypothetical protein